MPTADYVNSSGGKHIAKVNFDAAGLPVSKDFLHPDSLGSTSAITDTPGALSSTLDYLPFGGFATGTGSLISSHEYNGKEFEPESGLYNYGARYYNPTLGRFMSTDPAGGAAGDPQSLNRYAYVSYENFRYQCYGFNFGFL